MGEQSRVRAARKEWWRAIIDAALPAELTRVARARAIIQAVDGWHSSTRDSYLQALNEFTRWMS